MTKRRSFTRCFLMFSFSALLKWGFSSQNGLDGSVVCIPHRAHTTEDVYSHFSDPAGQYRCAESGDGFRFRVMYDNQLIGILSIDVVTLPEYLDEYLNLEGITITETGEPGKRARFEIAVPKGGYRFNS